MQDTYGTYMVLRIKVAIGEGSTALGTVPVYVDDITVDTFTYPLEPIVLDAEYYHTGDTVTVTVADIYENDDPIRTEEVTVHATSDTDIAGIEVTLTETGVNTGIFVGSFPLVPPVPEPGPDELGVSDGDTITVEYKGLTDTAIVDDTAPVFTSVSDGDYYRNTDTIILRADLDEVGLTVTADFSAIDSGYTIGDETVEDNGDTTYTITYTITEENTRPDGEYTIPVTAEDAAGNTATYTGFSTTLDNTAPSVTDPIADPSIIQPATPTDVTFTVSVSDELSGVASVAINLTSIGGAEDQAMTEIDGVYTYEWLNLEVAEEGTYILPITATDNVGNVNDTVAITLQVVADTEGPSAPVFTEVVPICGGLVIRGLYAEDLLTGVNRYEILMNGTDGWTITETDLTATEWTPGVNCGTFERAAVLAGYAGEYVNITVIAYDCVNNPSDEIILYEGVIPEGEWYPVVLYEGWNLISLPLIPKSTDSSEILSLILKQGGAEEVFGWDDGWQRNPTTMEDGKGYWIEMQEYDVLIVQGYNVAEPPGSPPPVISYSLSAGWNLAGFTSTTNMPASDYLASLETDSYYTRLYTWNAEAQRWMSVSADGGSLTPGQGFWIYMYKEQTLIPPV